MEGYDWPEEVSDEAIKTAFANAKSMDFLARNFNPIQFQHVGFKGELIMELPMIRVLSLIGITPQMLRPVFNPQRKYVKRRFPFNFYWFGLNGNRYKFVDKELPEQIESYEQLGSLPITQKKPFQELAKILGKPVKVMLKEDGKSFFYFLLFTAYPSGEIIEAEKA